MGVNWPLYAFVWECDFIAANLCHFSRSRHVYRVSDQITCLSRHNSVNRSSHSVVPVCSLLHLRILPGLLVSTVIMTMHVRQPADLSHILWTAENIWLKINKATLTCLSDYPWSHALVDLAFIFLIIGDRFGSPIQTGFSLMATINGKPNIFEFKSNSGLHKQYVVHKYMCIKSQCHSWLDLVSCWQSDCICQP